MARLAVLEVGDGAELWGALGFAVGPACCLVGATVVALGAETPGIGAWRLEGAASAVDGLAEADAHTPPQPAAHPNGVQAIDHVVVATPNLDRTLAALDAAGLELRRTRQAGGGEDGQARTQAFFMLERTVLEVVGPTEAAGDGPAHLWGVTFTVADLDATVAFFGDRIGVARDAVQPGRRIATLRRSAGSGVPMAFMSAHVAR